MMSRVNPFPDYPVVTLKDDPEGVRNRTIPTEAISESHHLLQEYIDQWKNRKTNPNQTLKSAVVRIQGDYGTGKTHLLVDAAARVDNELSPMYDTITILRVPALELAPVEWFREAVRTALIRPSQLKNQRTFFKDIIMRLYAKAGGDVAAQADLTKLLVKTLEADYNFITKAIEENFLNITAVNQRFEQLLTSICQDVSVDVKRALSGLFLDRTEKAATAWLVSDEISSEDAGKLQIPRRMTKEEDASGILIALAGIHNYVECPFGFMIDELEHLIQYDLSKGRNKNNVTWLKRLVEGLASNKSLVYVAGHNTAWDAEEVKTDFLDRFPPDKSIMLRKLTGDEVLKIVKWRNSNLPPQIFALAHAEEVVRLTNGNIRRVLTMCRALFRSSSGFSKPVTIEEIGRIAEDLKQAISIEEATVRVREIMESQGLAIRVNGSVQAPGTISGNIKFDLVGDLDGQPKVIAELKHAIDQRTLIDEARRFIAQVGEVTNVLTGVLAIFVADGNIDDELLARLGAGNLPHMVWFDLTQRDVFNAITGKLTSYLKGGQILSPEVAQLEKLEAETRSISRDMAAARENANEELVTELEKQRVAIDQQVKMLQAQMGESSKELERELTELEQKRKAELAELHNRLEELSQQMATRDADLIKPQKEEIDSRLNATYSELTQPALFSTKARLALSGRNLLILIVYVVFALALAVIGQVLGSRVAGMWATSQGSYDAYKFGFSVLSYIPLLLTILIVWAKVSQTDAFFDYNNRLLREMYVQSATPKDLVKASNILRSSLEEYGPLRGRYEANDRLADAFPEVFGHLTGSRK